MTPKERAEFIADVAEATRPKTPKPQISEEQLHWVNLAIQKEAQSNRLREAIIEKTITSLVWSAFVGVAYLILDFFKNHGGKL